MSMTPKQRAHLRKLSHKVKPVQQVGKEGVTDALVRSVEDAFRNRELLKVKLTDAAPEKVQEAGAAIAGRIEGAELVFTIGRTAVLYREHPERPEIRLPRE
jgi:RNA-binding protein